MAVCELSHQRDRSHVRVENSLAVSVGRDRGERRVGRIERPTFNRDAPREVLEKENDYSQCA
jgi:hypothetical protein